MGDDRFRGRCRRTRGPDHAGRRGPASRVPGAPAERRRRAALEARHDRVLESLGVRLVGDLAHHLLDELELLEALTAAQDTRTGDDDHRYWAAVRDLEAQWKATTADLTPTRTA